jgi:hypothetical protein
MPGFIKPQLATLKSKAPKGEQWLHEIKYDGYRVQVHLNRGRKKVYTRNGLERSRRKDYRRASYLPQSARVRSFGQRQGANRHATARDGPSPR